MTTQEQQIKALQKELKDLRKQRQIISLAITDYSRRMDVLMKGPSTPERGSKLAKILNALLGVDKGRATSLDDYLTKESQSAAELERMGLR